jgi:hypothetical protein
MPRGDMWAAALSKVWALSRHRQVKRIRGSSAREQIEVAKCNTDIKLRVCTCICAGARMYLLR